MFSFFVSDSHCYSHLHLVAFLIHSGALFLKMLSETIMQCKILDALSSYLCIAWDWIFAAIAV